MLYIGMDSKGIGISHLPNQRYRSFCRKGVNYNIMVVGSGGVGKSTFINRLFRTDIIPKNVSDNATITFKDNYNLSETIDMPETYDYRDALLNFEITEIEMADSKFHVNIGVTEVDNVGDKIDNTDCWISIKNYINDLYNDYYLQSRENVKALVKDRRIHVCIYFIDSCGNPARETDICVMKEISKICNIIPVISKCDILLNDEMDFFYDKILREIEKQQIEIYYPEGDTIKPPYFVMSQRCGRWGNINDNSDFSIVKDVLIQNGMIDLIEKTEQFYEFYRGNVITQDISKSQMMNNDLKLKAEFIERLKNEDGFFIQSKKSLIDKIGIIEKNEKI